MKILYVCTTTDLGGAENALRTLALAARQAGHTVKIISLKPAGAVANYMRADGLEVVSLDLQEKFSPVQTTGALVRLTNEIQTFQPDVVHAFLYRAIELCRQAKRRVEFTLLTTPHYDLSKKNYLLRLWDRALKNADDVSCAESEQTADFLKEKQKYNAQKIRLVCNGVDTTKFAPDPQARAVQRKKWDVLPGNVVFCCVARLSKEKNHLLLLEAFAAVYAKNPHARLVLVGDGAEKFALQHFVQKHHLEKGVSFAGEVPDVRPYLQGADVFVLPSQIESLPLSLLEACACGLPAIVSRVGDMPRVVAHGETGFVFNGKDPVLLSALMAELLENADLREQMGKNARTRTEKNYPPAEPQYLQIYTEIK